MLRTAIFSCLLVIVLSSNLCAQKDLYFEHFFREQGLSNNSVRQIIQDKYGYLWFGTLNGLDKYNGVKFKSYYHERGIKGSIKSNRIAEFFEDGMGGVWILTFDGKALRYDQPSDSFTDLSRFLSDKENENLKIKHIYETHKNELYCISTNKGCVRVTLNSNNKIESVKHLHKDNLLPDNRVNFVFLDKRNKVWIGTEGGLVKVEGEKTVEVSNPFGVKLRNQSLAFRSYLDMDSVVYFGTYSNGVYVYHHNNSVLKYNAVFEMTVNKPITSIRLLNKEQLYMTANGAGFILYNIRTKKIIQYLKGDFGLEDESIHGPFMDSRGLLWFKASKRGVYQFDTHTQKFTYFGLNADKRESIGDPEKIIFFEDSNHTLWLGIYGGGICRYNANTNSFDQYMYDSRYPNGISSDYVLTLFEDNSKNLWIGTLRGGVNKINLKKSHFTVRQPQPNAKLKLRNEVRSVLEDSKQRLWVGTKSGEIYCYGKDDKVLAQIPEMINDKSNYIKSGVYALMEDSLGNLWVGTKGEGIYVFKDIINQVGNKSLLKTNIVHFKHIADNSNSLSNNDVYDLLQVSKNQVWIATHNYGLDVITNPLENAVFRNYTANDTIAHSISGNNLRDLFKDQTGNIWIGSANGLNYIPREHVLDQDKKFSVIKGGDDPDELSHNDVLCINQTRDGDIWCGTFGGGINRLKYASIDSTPFKWITYSKNYGLSSSVIYSILEDKEGNLWVSSDFGISKFNTSKETFENFYIKEKHEANVYSEGAGGIQKDGRFIFGHLNGFTSFYPHLIGKDKSQFPIYITEIYVFNDKLKPGKNYVQSWSNATKSKVVLKHNENFLTFNYAILDYTHPEEIEYAYKLEGLEDQWNSVGGSHSAVYKGLPQGEYVFKVTGTNSDGVMLNEFASVNVKILAPWWKNFYAILLYVLIVFGMVAGLGSVILKQLNLRNQLKLEKDSFDNKIRFYTNISHELKTPLSLILGPAEDIMHIRNIPESASYKAGEILNNAKRMLKLIDQLIDFRKVQKGHVVLKVTKVDVMELFRNIYLCFLPLAEKRKLNFIFEPIQEELIGFVDVDKIEKITFNLISNAFKHTSKGKNIKLKFSMDKQFSFSVVDEGKGITPGDLPHIFKRFQLFDKSDNSMGRSSGIGLSLTKELVQIHKGTISVDSKLGEGSIFKVTIPIAESDYLAEEIVSLGKSKMHSLDFINEHVNGEVGVVELDPELDKRSAGPDASKILVVEDNEELRSYLVTNFKPYFNVIFAKNGEEGVKLARKEFPDLIICDVMMPIMNGIEVTKILKTDFNTSHIPIILLTAMTLDEQKYEGLEVGADAYVTKPFSLNLLKIQVRKLIEQRKKLIQKYGEKVEVSPVELGGTNADQVFLTKVISIIEENMANVEFNVGSIVDQFGYGRTVFYKKIKAISGYPPNDFVKIIRMKKAASALKNTEMTVSEISNMVGFNDANYFSRTFKKHFGVTPSEYRRQN